MLGTTVANYSIDTVSEVNARFGHSIVTVSTVWLVGYKKEVIGMKPHSIHSRHHKFTGFVGPDIYPPMLKLYVHDLIPVRMIVHFLYIFHLQTGFICTVGWGFM